MSRRKKYRIFLCIMLFMGLTGLGFLSVDALKEEIPNELNVRNASDVLDFGWLITEKVTPESEYATSNAFSAREYQVECKLLGMIPLKTVDVQITEAVSVYTGGIPVGIYLETNGVLIIGTGIIEGKDGLNYEPALNLVQPGDYILAVNHEEILGKEELVKLIAEQDGGEVILTLRREEEIIDVRLETVETADGSYKTGIWVRDNTQGIGTLTFVTKEKDFGALGHGINDVDTGLLLETQEGSLYHTKIQNIQKGERGNPGELSGTILYGTASKYGSISKNESVGIFGICTSKLIRESGSKLVETVFKQEVKEGPAIIRSAVSGTLTDYKIEITEVNCSEKNVNKGIVFKVTDQRLLDLTGGIVQGMSGSPILQDGKLAGAVTHVFVQDSTKGFGIFIENMLEQVD